MKLRPSFVDDFSIPVAKEQKQENFPSTCHGRKQIWLHVHATLVILKETGIESQVINQSNISSVFYLNFHSAGTEIFLEKISVSCYRTRSPYAVWIPGAPWKKPYCLLVFSWRGSISSPFPPFEPQGTPRTPARPNDGDQCDCRVEKDGL